MQDSNVRSWPSLLANPSLANEFHKGPRAAVEDREFQIVEFDDRIVNPHSNQRGEQVFGGRNQHALLHQTGGVADAGHIPAYRLNLKTFEINTPKNNAGVRGCGKDAKLNRSARSQTDTVTLDCRANCLLLNQT